MIDEQTKREAIEELIDMRIAHAGSLKIALWEEPPYSRFIGLEPSETPYRVRFLGEPHERRVELEGALRAFFQAEAEVRHGDQTQDMQLVFDPGFYREISDQFLAGKFDPSKDTIEYLVSSRGVKTRFLKPEDCLVRSQGG